MEPRRLFFAWLLLVFAFGATLATEAADSTESAKTVYVIPIRENIDTPMTYLVRRGVKQAIEAKADLLVLDMDTNGGRLDSTEEIIEALNQFDGKTATFVNRKAFSAGAFIAFGTAKIFMAPQSVIGAATPIMVGPGGGVEGLPESVEAKMTSAVAALVRTSAEKNGHNPELVEAMIDRNKEVQIEGEIINEKGEILTLTNVEAEREFNGEPLLSSGTVSGIGELLDQMGFGGAKVVQVEPTGAEQVATWLTGLAPLLLLAGIIGVYIEMKTPGFGIPGIVGLVAFLLYFLGGFVAGLSGLEWVVIFVIGLGLFVAELFILPGTLFLGLIGGAMMLAALVMAMVDFYPGMPAVPSFDMVSAPLMDVLLAGALAMVVILVLSRFMLKTPVFNKLVDQGVSGMASLVSSTHAHAARLGEVGVTISTLRPGGKAQFGNDILDVISQGELVPRGAKVRILSFSGPEAVVEWLQKVDVSS